MAQPPRTHEGEALKAYAKEKGLKINALSLQLGVTRQTLHKWFKKPALDPDAVLLILNKMEPAPAFLLGITGEPSLTTLLTEIRTVKAMLTQLLHKDSLQT